MCTKVAFNPIHFILCPGRMFAISNCLVVYLVTIPLTLCSCIFFSGLGYSITGPEVLHVPPTEIDLSLSTLMVFTVSGCNEIHVYLCANEGDTTADYYELSMGTKTWVSYIHFLSKHETFTQCWLDVGPAS